MTPKIDAQNLSEIAKVFYEMPLAGTVAILVMFILGLSSFIVIMWRSNNKAEREDTVVKHKLAEAITQLSSRMGRVIKGLERRDIDIPENGDDDDETLILTDMLNGKAKT